MKKFLLVLTLVSAGASAVAAISRSDCPGTKICPLTGRPVCVDRCPLNK